jgi:hypothetical protein
MKASKKEEEKRNRSKLRTGSWQPDRIGLKLHWKRSLVTDVNTYKAGLIDSCPGFLTLEFEDQSEATWIRSEAGELRSLPRDKLKKKKIPSKG